MPKLEVHYLFTCKNCAKVNTQQIEIRAADKTGALELTHAAALCSECFAALEPRQIITTTIQQLD